MFFLKGTRTALIKIYSDNTHRCDSCKDFDITVAVYQQYFHFFFLPVAPTGDKFVKAYCNKCSQPFRNDTMNREYEAKTKAPFYLYAMTIIVALLIIVVLGINIIHNS
jgi:hypothetical protein